MWRWLRARTSADHRDFIPATVGERCADCAQRARIGGPCDRSPDHQKIRTVVDRRFGLREPPRSRGRTCVDAGRDELERNARLRSVGSGPNKPRCRVRTPWSTARGPTSRGCVPVADPRKSVSVICQDRRAGRSGGRRVGFSRGRRFARGSQHGTPTARMYIQHPHASAWRPRVARNRVAYHET